MFSDPSVAPFVAGTKRTRPGDSGGDIRGNESVISKPAPKRSRGFSNTASSKEALTEDKSSAGVATPEGEYPEEINRVINERLKSDKEKFSAFNYVAFNYLFAKKAGGKDAAFLLKEKGVLSEELVETTFKSGARSIINLAAFMHSSTEALPKEFADQRHELITQGKTFADASEAGFKAKDIVKIISHEGSSCSLETLCKLLNDDSKFEQLKKARVTPENITAILSVAGGSSNLNALCELLNPPTEDSITLTKLTAMGFTLEDIIKTLSINAGSKNLEACKKVLPVYEKLPRDAKGDFKMLVRQSGASKRIELLAQLLEKHGDGLKGKEKVLINFFKKTRASEKIAGFSELTLDELLKKIAPEEPKTSTRRKPIKMPEAASTTLFNNLLSQKGDVSGKKRSRPFGSDNEVAGPEGECPSKFTTVIDKLESDERKISAFSYLFVEVEGQTAAQILEKEGILLEELAEVTLKTGGERSIINLAAFMHRSTEALPKEFADQQHELITQGKTFADAREAGFKAKDIIKIISSQSGGARNLEALCKLLNDDSKFEQLKETRVTPENITAILSAVGGSGNLNALCELLNPPTEDSITLTKLTAAGFTLEEIIKTLSMVGGAKDLEACKKVLPVYEKLPRDAKDAFKALVRIGGVSERIELFAQLLEKHGDGLKGKEKLLIDIFKARGCSGKKVAGFSELTLDELLEKIASEEPKTSTRRKPIRRSEAASTTHFNSLSLCLDIGYDDIFVSDDESVISKPTPKRRRNSGNAARSKAAPKKSRSSIGVAAPEGGYPDEFTAVMDKLRPNKNKFSAFSYLFVEVEGQTAAQILKEEGIPPEKLLEITLKRAGEKSIINLAAFMHRSTEALSKEFADQRHKLITQGKTFADAKGEEFIAEDIVKIISHDGGSCCLEALCNLLNDNAKFEQLKKARVTPEKITAILSHTGGPSNLRALCKLLNPTAEGSIAFAAGFTLEDIIKTLSINGGSKNLEACKGLWSNYGELASDAKEAFKLLIRQAGASERIELLAQLLKKHGDGLKGKEKVLIDFFKKACTNEKVAGFSELTLDELLEKIASEEPKTSTRRKPIRMSEEASTTPFNNLLSQKEEGPRPPAPLSFLDAKEGSWLDANEEESSSPMSPSPSADKEGSELDEELMGWFR